MKIGAKRIALAKILSDLTGLDYPASGLSQANRSQDKRKRVNYDAWYWNAQPKNEGAVLSSTYTMGQIIEAYNAGKTIAIKDNEVSVKG